MQCDIQAMWLLPQLLWDNLFRLLLHHSERTWVNLGGVLL